MRIEHGVLSRPGAELAYTATGQGEWIVLCHALATRQELWHRQIESLAPDFAVLSFDLRGHGASPPPESCDYSFESQGDDVVALMDHLDIHRAALVGISVGGEVAQMAAARQGRRFSRLVLSSTACHTDDQRAAAWAQRIQDARTLGMSGIAPATVSRWFSKRYADEYPDVVEWCRECVASTPLESYVGLAKVIQTMDLRPLIGSITCPTLIVCGDQDHNTGPATASTLQHLIPCAELSVISGAGHFPNLEQPQRFNDLLKDFLD
jgi:3-oxoadipate enol-lactonase